MTIPRILHQLAKTEEIPPHLQGFQDSWRRLNPDYAYHLWTDQSLEAWVSEQAPEFLPLFLAYPRSICRADLGRYLLLNRIGGVYADLDCQCLRPIAPLLAGRPFAIATEPAAHHNQAAVQERGLNQIVCPSFIASEAGHPFWLEVFDELRRIDPSQVLTSTDVLDATGPFLLSRVFTSNPQHEQHLINSEQIYPFSKEDCWHGLIFDLVFWSERTRNAFVAHYWDSSWFRPSSGWQAGVPSQAPVHLHQPPWPLPGSEVIGRSIGLGGQPLISCLMVTRGRTHQARQAIDCFLAQTYECRELIIVDDDPHSELASEIARSESCRIRHVRLPDQGLSLGVLRNIALEHADGDYICQWDDDDLHDPARLEVQWQTMQASGAQASILARWLIWWPHLRRLAVSRYRDWEGSLLCERSLMPRYPDQRCGEDSDVVARLMQNVRVARIDMPRLYVYICHGTNTFTSDHFEPHWHQASAQWEQADCERLEQELDRRLPLLRYRQGLVDLSVSQQHPAAPLPSAVPMAAPIAMAGNGRTAAAPRVLILTPVRDGVPFLDRYVSLLERLDFDDSCLSLAWMEGDSVDGSFEALEQLQPRLARRFRRVALHRHHLHPSGAGGARLARSQGSDHSVRLAEIRNRLLLASLDDEDWVLWLDLDLLDYPDDLLRQLLGASREIVTAWRSGSPPGAADQPLRDVGGKAGMPLLVRADLHRRGLNFPIVPLQDRLGTEGFLHMARAQGVRCWALPSPPIPNA
jgi:glycosyltransferase involved in cell wall biosynthesis